MNQQDRTHRLLTLSNRVVNAAIYAGGQRTINDTRRALMHCGVAFGKIEEIANLLDYPNDAEVRAEVDTIDSTSLLGFARAVNSMEARTLAELRGHAKQLREYADTVHRCACKVHFAKPATLRAV